MTFHAVAPKDRKRIQCQRCHRFARWCEHAVHSCGVSFFYYCGTHWWQKGPSGTSPMERAATGKQP